MFDWFKKGKTKPAIVGHTESNIEANSPRTSNVNTDRPINSGKSDKLGRRNFADVIVKQIAESPSDDSYVIGLTGPWGFGKTSILNMVDEGLTKDAKAHVIWFNPWMFSGTEQLLGQFFRELAAQLGNKGVDALKSLGEQIQTYGTLLSPISSIPFIKGWIGDIKEYTDAAGDILQGLPQKNASVFDQRKKIEKLLKKIDRPISIFIDDIDRLREEEVRDIMKLVRLTADFPNVVYVLSFDRERVEKALDEGHGDGRAYLEKILQLTFEVPQLRDSQIRQLLLEELESTLKDEVTGPLHSSDWQNYYHMGIHPMVTNLRDVRRYINALPSAVALMGEEIALSDVLAMEAIRVFCPKSFSLLPETIEPLTNVASSYGGRSDKQEDEKQKNILDTFFAAADGREAALRRMISELFPCSQKYTSNTSFGSDWLKNWRMNGRVAHPDNLRFYLEKNFPANEFPIREVHKFFEAMKTGAELQAIIDSMSMEQFEKMLSRMQDYEEKYTAEMAENAIPILLNNAHKVREERQQMFDFGGDVEVKRLVYRLLRHLKTEEERLKVVNSVLPRINTISNRLDVVNIVSHKESVGHGLVPQAEVDKLDAELKDQIAQSTRESLLKEKDLPWLLQWIADSSAENLQIVAQHLTDDMLFLKVLRSSLSEAFSSSLGQAAQKKTHTLPWPGLQKLVGENLNQRVTDLFNKRASLNLDHRTLLALEVAEKYVTGKRKPGRAFEDFDEDE